jgi:hypothetical protein
MCRCAPGRAAMRAAAADPDVGELLEQDSQRRYQTYLVVMGEVAERSSLAPGTTVTRAAQLLHSILSLETYGLFVIEHGWTVQEWSDFAKRTVSTEIFPRAECQTESSNGAQA